MDRRAIEDIFQEVILQFEEMKPTIPGGLEDGGRG